MTHPKGSSSERARRRWRKAVWLVLSLRHRLGNVANQEFDLHEITNAGSLSVPRYADMQDINLEFAHDIEDKHLELLGEKVTDIHWLEFTTPEGKKSPAVNLVAAPTVVAVDQSIVQDVEEWDADEVMNLTGAPKKRKRGLMSTSKHESSTSSHDNYIEIVNKLVVLCGIMFPTEAVEQNLVYSPFAIRIMLGLAAAGAKIDAANEICTFFGHPRVKAAHKLNNDLLKKIAHKSVSSEFNLSFATAIWHHKTMNLSYFFLQTARDSYKAEIFPSDFEEDNVCNQVNSWAKERTNGKIINLMPPVTKIERCVFANCLSFKGEWVVGCFDRSYTTKRTFNLLDGNTKDVLMMTSSCRTHFIATCNGFKILRLSYRGQKGQNGTYSMYFCLPDDPKGLKSMVAQLEDLSALEHHIKSDLKSVQSGEIWIPKFSFTSRFDAMQFLSDLDLSLIFRESGFSSSVSSKEDYSEYHLSSLHQEATISIDEDGTSAVAASDSTISMCPKSTTNKVDFVAEHPFLFFIRDEKTQVILLYGYVVDPTETGLEENSASSEEIS